MIAFTVSMGSFPLPQLAWVTLAKIPTCYLSSVIYAVVTVKLRRVELLMELVLRATGATCRVGSYSVTFRPTQVNMPGLNPSQRLSYFIVWPFLLQLFS